VFTDGKWTVQADWRGVPLFNIEGGEPVEPIDQLGITPTSRNATHIKPIAKEAHTIPMFKDGQWVLDHDWRGVILYKKDDCSQVSIDRTGVLPADVGATDTPPPTREHSWQNNGWALDATKVAAKLVTTKATAMTTINTEHEALIQRLDGNPTQAEKDSWPLKIETATAILANKTPSALGTAFLTGSGITTAAAQTTWANAVLANANNHARYVGAAEKIRTIARTAVTAATDELGVRDALKAQVDAGAAVPR
jgi:hypothetical protein